MSRASHRTAVVRTIGGSSFDTGRVATRGGVLATSVEYVFRVVGVTGAAKVDARGTGRFSSLPWVCATPEHPGAVMHSIRAVAARVHTPVGCREGVTPRHSSADVSALLAVCCSRRRAHGGHRYTKPQHHTRGRTYPWRRYAQD